MALFDTLSPRTLHVLRFALVWAVVMVMLISLINWFLVNEYEGLLYLLMMFSAHFAFGLFMGWIDWHGRIELKRRAKRKRHVETD